jgi:hypothetical protein
VLNDENDNEVQEMAHQTNYDILDENVVSMNNIHDNIANTLISGD